MNCCKSAEEQARGAAPPFIPCRREEDESGLTWGGGGMNSEGLKN